MEKKVFILPNIIYVRVRNQITRTECEISKFMQLTLKSEDEEKLMFSACGNFRQRN